MRARIAATTSAPFEAMRSPAVPTAAIARTLNEDRPDLFITSGHATERDWQIGYAYRNGFFRCGEGALYVLLKRVREA